MPEGLELMFPVAAERGGWSPPGLGYRGAQGTRMALETTALHLLSHRDTTQNQARLNVNATLNCVLNCKELFFLDLFCLQLVE